MAPTIWVLLTTARSPALASTVLSQKLTYFARAVSYTSKFFMNLDLDGLKHKRLDKSRDCKTKIFVFIIKLFKALS